ncbi:WD40/YVTN/BNR-like repeat-containing protein [Psychromicrobium lacuslunae]|uniref:Glycosyl hydrolase n=1 Tax=Psychromicrobium lacuslunae TaxID=1618207 RepID=A0A0D4C1R3_9MICC|nr:sialidase family protein [Psychromicrobium lacuslunae]AJT42306.1 glycosyl hydrolase [Psychromicrobium lacuslunae]
MNSSNSVVLAIGTKKGLWLAQSEDRQHWRVSEPHFFMQEIPSIAIDTRQGCRLMVGVRSEHWGPTVAHSDDLGSTWTEPEEGAIRFAATDDAALERVWQLQPGGAHEPGVVWAGCEPISVWKSTDGGEHFELNRGLWDHPHRSEWGAGFGGAAVHTVLPPTENSERVLVAMSTGGVYRSEDGGTSWQPRNQGISAYFMPDPQPEFGQCVHKIARDAGTASTLYAQNHHGVYRSEDNGDHWGSIADGLPADFGFVMLTHPRRAGTAWVIPIKADGERIPPEGKLAVHRTDDGGSSWKRLDQGLPQFEYNVVLRDAAAVDDAETVGVYFGTRGGSVYASADEGESFSEVLSHLPDVLCVRAAVVQV